MSSCGGRRSDRSVLTVGTASTFYIVAQHDTTLAILDDCQTYRNAFIIMVDERTRHLDGKLQIDVRLSPRSCLGPNLLRVKSRLD